MPESVKPFDKPERIRALDQFRGFTVASMLLVNFIGGFHGFPDVLKHHNTYCSFADTVMPCFLFAVGFSLRLTFGRRLLKEGAAAAYAKVVMRLAALCLVSVVLYTPRHSPGSWSELTERWPNLLLTLFKREWFQALTHIAATSLWLLPVIRSSTLAVLGWTAFSACLHVLFSYWFNFQWTFSSPAAIDGGPLGFLTWTLPAATGAWSCDLILPKPGSTFQYDGDSRRPTRAILARFLLASCLTMLGGWLLSCLTRLYDAAPETANAINTSTNELSPHPVLPPAEAWAHWRQQPLKGRLAELPFLPPSASNQADGSMSQGSQHATDIRRRLNYWMMSQRAGTLSYLMFSAGFATALFAVFYLLCDRWNLRAPVLDTFGKNALAAYVLHEMTTSVFGSFAPDDSPLWFAIAITAAYMSVTYLLVRGLELRNIYIKL